VSVRSPSENLPEDHKQQARQDHRHRQRQNPGQRKVANRRDAEAHSIVDGNFPYKGALKIVSVPKGSTRQVSVSDIPNDRAPAPVEQISAARIMFCAPPPAPKPVSDRAAALERQMLPRQLSNSPRDATNRPA
jgi:hypothetical protein